MRLTSKGEVDINGFIIYNYLHKVTQCLIVIIKRNRKE